MNHNKIDIPEATVKLRSDGIMHIHVKLDMNIESEEAREIEKARKELAQDQRYPTLHTGSELVIPSSDVLKYMSLDKRSTAVRADAFVIKSLPQKLIAKMFVLKNQTNRPTAYFNNKIDAINWLSTFIEN